LIDVKEQMIDVANAAVSGMLQFSNVDVSAENSHIIKHAIKLSLIERRM